jgi:hypothetical protein
MLNKKRIYQSAMPIANISLTLCVVHLYALYNIYVVWKKGIIGGGIYQKLVIKEADAHERVFAYRTKTTAGKTVDARKLAGRRDSFR